MLLVPVQVVLVLVRVLKLLLVWHQGTYLLLGLLVLSVVAVFVSVLLLVVLVQLGLVVALMVRMDWN